MKHFLPFALLFFFGITFGQKGAFNAKEISVSPFVDGTIIIPEHSGKIPLAIIIGGSGPTDRNGNQQMMENNSLRYLAEGLFEQGIASFRYDKRILKQMKDRTLNEESIRFDEFIDDAKATIDFFKKGGEFSKIYVIGHSQGSLVGIVASQERADGFVSIAGAGQAIDKVIVAQLEKQAPGLAENGRNAFDEMKQNGSTTNYSQGISSIFRPSLQPFILSWMKYDPQIEIAKLEIPILIVNGDKDLQVHPSEAEILKGAAANAQFSIIKNMNHVLKEIAGDDLENQKSYNEYKRPVIRELITTIGAFIKN